jgi:threonine/homoserine/homoserine lactone efflux protein
MLELGLLAAAFTTIATILLGLVAVYQQFGLAVLWIAVGLLYLLYLGMQRRSSGYLDDGHVAWRR